MDDRIMTLSSKDKTPKASGWGCDFHYTVPQRHVRTFSGTLLVPLSADDLPPVPPQHVATVEKAISLLADLLSDRDHRSAMGDHRQLNEAADREAKVLRSVVDGGKLRSMLGVGPPDPLASKTGTFVAVTRRGRRAVGSTLRETLDAILAFHRHSAKLEVSDLTVIRDPETDERGGRISGWYVYDSKVSALDDDGRTEAWAFVTRVEYER